MRFGPERASEVEGAILAHTMRLGPRVVFKKGRVLSASDADILAEAGLSSVLVARLEQGDIGEDVAAERVARALAGSGLSVDAPSTGRANIVAAQGGLLQVEQARLDAVNRIDESITVATLRPGCRVHAGDMVATAKIIPFGVALRLLRRFEGLAAPGAILSIRPFRTLRVGLLLTSIPGTHPRAAQRAARSLRTRVERLGSIVDAELLVAHEPASVAAALTDLLARECDLVLALGASAIIDRRDVIPGAVSAVGGDIVHFGMPVDPGNLLLLARHGEVPIVGVPGCARSLKPSGFDLVLERLAAAMVFGPHDIMAMGAGGLLKEIASRPSPRRAPGQARRPRVAAIVLAAGQSRRMGVRNKLLAKVDGTPMVARAIEAARSAVDGPVIVVTGHERDDIESIARDFNVLMVHNPHHADGMSTSLRAGIRALQETQAECDAAVVCLGDMPWVRAAHIEALIAAFDPAGGAAICVPTYDNKRGNPVLWDRRFWSDMTNLQGDVGARELIQSNSDSVRMVEVGDAGIIVDVDTEVALSEVNAAPKHDAS